MSTSRSFFAGAMDARRGFLLFLATIGLVIIGTIIGQLPLSYLVLASDPQQRNVVLSDPSTFGLDQTWLLVLMILSFAGGLAGLAAGVKWLHHQSFVSLITPWQKVDWRRIGHSFVFWFGLTVLIEIILYIMTPEHYHWSYRASKFWWLLIVTIFLLPIQTSFEEIVFRGYLLQQMGVFFNNKWIALILTSVIFGLMHSANPEVKAFGFTTMMIYYIGFGLLLGLCTLLDDRLELALGMHAATNIYGATMVTFKESAIQTPALITLEHLDLPIMTLLFFLSALLFFLYFAKRFHWTLRGLRAVVSDQQSDDAV